MNVSTRSRVGGAAGELTAGFVVGGGASRRILLRACGPSLRKFGVNEALADPVLRLCRQYDGGEIARNTGWSRSTATEQSLRDAMQQAGAFAWDAGSADSALVVTLAPGAYTAIITSAATNEGVALAEVYQLP